MIEFNFTVDGERQMSRFFDIAADSINDFTIIFEKLAEDFRETQKEVFKKEGANEGLSKWKPLSPKYKKWKNKFYPGRPILTLTGDMRKSLTQQNNINHIERITKNSFEIGTKDFKTILHQKGTKKMPKRKVIELSDLQKRRWTQIFHREIFSMLSPSEREAIQRGTTIGRR